MQDALFEAEVFDVKWRECRRCIEMGRPGRYPEQFFRPSRTRVARDLAPRRRRICMGCEWETKDDRALRKSIARRIEHHAQRHKTPLDDYRDRYGISIDGVLKWWKVKVATGVLDCGCSVSEMSHGSKDIEMHQLDSAAPYFPLQWQLVCTNHHRQIALLSEADYRANQRGWQLFREARALEDAA